MTIPTPTLGLITYNTTTDGSQLFITYRTDQAGVSSTSNMGKIDAWAAFVNGSLISLAANKPLYSVDATYISPNYYEATVAAITEYSVNMIIALTLDITSSGTTILNINGLGTISLLKADVNGNLVNLDANELKIGKRYCFMYNGSAWEWVDATSIEQISSSGSPNCLLMTSACGVIADSGVKIHPSGSKIDANYIAAGSTLAVVSGSLCLSETIISGSYNKVETDVYGRIVSGSITGLTVKESDGDPSVSYVETIEFSGATISNSGSNVALVTVSSGGADILEIQVFS